MDTGENNHTNTTDLNNSNPSSDSQRMDGHLNYPSLNLAAAKPPGVDGVLSPKGGNGSPCSPGMAGSPGSLSLTIPSPIITKRTRTNSTYDRAMDNPIEKGRIKNFNRGQGHGFIVSDRNGEEIFVHVSDIEGEYVPKEGDEVTYRICPIPPKLEKHQAIHVRIINFTPDVHLRWDSPLLEDEKNEATPPLVVD